MGQGFAHQIFVVFQNEHPEIRLIPINMSDGVAKMYAHVTGTAGQSDQRIRESRNPSDSDGETDKTGRYCGYDSVSGK